MNQSSTAKKSVTYYHFKIKISVKSLSDTKNLFVLQKVILLFLCPLF